ncbi:AAA family ATPase [Streptomyces sp. AC495_CC817]|uniref:helix-turn-helix transcriptional regulator n=1 Tax=Streptomyces sp. AC495_CC817 TaxID=2823900 RepID=UPI001C259726|nr:AAA family ATPase [Streptomyces sp. AC495_CC817]
MFIGRNDELRRLRALLDSEPDAAHRVVLIEGPLGIGKTALLTELLRTGARQRVLFARPDEVATNIPLAGIRSIIEELLHEDLTALLADRAPRALQRDVLDALDASPRVIVIDDAHWLDDAALDLVRLLLAHPPATALTLILCARSGAASDELLRAIARGGASVHRIELGPLSDADAAALLRERGAADSGVVDLAGGNPLFLRILADVSRSSAPDPLRPETMEIGDALRGELSSLDPDALSLLHALSLTPSAPPAVLLQLTGADPHALADAAERLDRRGLIEADGLRITHPFIRAAAYRHMPRAERMRAHRLAAENAADLLERASHLQHLGPHLAPAEIDAVVQAAELVSSTSPRSGIALLERTTRVPHRPRDLALARALLLDGRPVEAEALLRRVHSSEPPTGEALSLLMQSLRIQSRPEEAFELARDAGAATLAPEVIVELATLAVMHDGDAEIDARTWLAEGDTRPGHATALAGLRALSHLRVGDLTRGREAYRVAKAGFETLTASELLPVLDAVTAMGWCAHFLADFDDGARLVERGIRLAESRGRFHVLPHLYLILSFLCIPLDRCDEAEELAQLSLDAARRYNWPDAVPLALTAALVAAPGRTTPEEFAERHRRLAEAGLPRVLWWRRIVRLLLARASILLGEPADVDDLAVGRHDIFASQKHIGLGELAAAQGDLDAALAHADAAIAWGEEAEHPSQAGHGTMLRAQLRARQGRLADAVIDARTAVVLFDRAGAVLYRRLAEGAVARFEALASEQRRIGAFDVLTRRERDVAELVADGHTNRAIAERLYLSPRTVESHVARILQKTGLRSRAGIARHLDGAPSDDAESAG